MESRNAKFYYALYRQAESTCSLILVHNSRINKLWEGHSRLECGLACSMDSYLCGYRVQDSWKTVTNLLAYVAVFQITSWLLLSWWFLWLFGLKPLFIPRMPVVFWTSMHKLVLCQYLGVTGACSTRAPGWLHALSKQNQCPIPARGRQNPGIYQTGPWLRLTKPGVVSGNGGGEAELQGTYN